MGASFVIFNIYFQDRNQYLTLTSLRHNTSTHSQQLLVEFWASISCTAIYKMTFVNHLITMAGLILAILSAVLAETVPFGHLPSNFYEMLGVSKQASTKEIRKAFKKMALKDHPDKNPVSWHNIDYFCDHGDWEMSCTKRLSLCDSMMARTSHHTKYKQKVIRGENVTLCACIYVSDMYRRSFYYSWCCGI